MCQSKASAREQSVLQNRFRLWPTLGLSFIIGLLWLGFPLRTPGDVHYVYHERTTNSVLGGPSANCAGVQPYVDVLNPPTAQQAYTLRFKVEFRLETDFATVYYTTDGSNPAGSLGVGSNTTGVVMADYHCFYTNGGTVDICLATIPAQPLGTTVKYIVAAWHTDNNIELFANSHYCDGCPAFTNSAQATLFQYIVGEPPLITTQPQSRTNRVGTDATFSVTASGTPPLTYQWYFRTTNALNGQTNSVLTLNNVQLNQAGAYHVVVANASGRATSAVATISISFPPFITSDPTNFTAVQGQTASFSVGAGGDAPLRYQWRFNGGALSAATNSSHSIINVQGNQAGNYDVIVTNALGSVTSRVAVLTVLVPPFIIAQPASLTVTQGNIAQFSVSAGGSAPLRYQWRLNNTDLAGRTNATLLISNAQPSQAGNYTVRVSNGAGEILSATAGLTVFQPPFITVQPASLVAIQGQKVTLKVTAIGDAPLSYRWAHNGIDLAGATNDNLTFNSVQASNAGSYRVFVSNPVGSTTSAVATLTVHTVDFGDAPDPGYPTLLSSDGARHILVDGIQLGTSVDFEGDGQPNAGATGDDLNGGDEDGVSFGPLFAGQRTDVIVVASTNGILNAWVDFNSNNSWADAGEQIFSNRALSPGENFLDFLIPTNAVVGNRFARFRFSTAGGLSFVGQASNGEVEDYALNIRPPADLALTMGDSPDPVVVGNDITYTLSMTNRGPGAATDVIISDPLPSKLTFVSAIASQGSCANIGNTVTCQLGSLAAGGSGTVTIVARTVAAGTISNTASVAAAEFDSNSSNNTAAQVSSIVNVPPPFSNSDFILIDDILSSGGDPYPSTIVVSGLTSAVYKVTATLNALTHSFPDDLDILLVGPNGRAVMLMSDAGSTLAVNDITLTFDDSASAPAPNTNEIVSGTYRPSNHGSLGDGMPAPAPPGPYDTSLSAFNGMNANGTWSLYVFDDLPENGGYIDGWRLNITTSDPLSDLSVTQTDSPDPTTVGTNITYSITVSNRGPAAALGTVLTDILPAGVNLVSMAPSVGNCMNQNGLIMCFLGNIASGSGAAVAIVVTPTLGGVFTNGVTATSSHLDPNSSNNTAFVTTTVAIVTDLAVGMAGAPEPVLLGQNVTYTLQVTNYGPNTATGVNLTDALPSGLNFVSASASQGSCSNFNGTVTCLLGSLGSQGRATVTLVCRPTVVGTITNSVTVMGNQFDDHLSDNVAATLTTVLPAADVSLSMADAPDPAGVGQNVTYTLVVSNRGPSVATNLALVNPLPGSVTFVAVQATSGSCANDAGVLNCALGTLAGGEQAVVTLTVSPTSLGSVTNQANVTSSPTDPNMTNNNATAVTAVIPMADLGVAVTDLPDPVWRGENLPYTVVISNRGPNQATGVRLTDVLPGGASLVSLTPSQGSCTNTGGTISCNLGTINSGFPISVSIVVAPTGGSRMTNTASIVANEFDPDLAGNTHRESTDVLTSAGSFANTGAIDIPELGAATPYPSTIFVSGLTTSVRQVRITLTNLSHPYPEDLDILLVGPDGQGVMLMSDAGGTGGVSNARLVFDDAAPLLLPDEGQILSGQFRPTDYDPGLDSLPAPAPAGPYQTNLSAFQGINPNGTWSLYAVDDTRKDGGVIAGGWRIEFAVGNPIADLSVTMQDFPDPVAVGSNLTYSIVVTNHGPGSASNVVVTNALPQGLALISASASQGSCTSLNGSVVCTLGSLGSGNTALVTIAGVPAMTGTLADSVHVAAPLLDLVLSNNTAQVVTRVEAPPVIVVQPQGGGTTNGGSFSFSVTASGTQPLTYQWLRNGIPILDATNDTLVLNPVLPGQSGDYTVRVDNEVGSVLSAPARLSVTSPPGISQIPDQITDEDTATPPIHFTVMDPESAPETLTVTGSSSNPALVPDSNIRFDGIGGDRTVRVFPATNQFGTAVITVHIMDPDGGMGSGTFLLTVNPVADPPMLASISTQTTDEDTPLILTLTVDDVDTGGEGLVLLGTSAAPTLVSEANIVFEGTGNVRTATITPLLNQFGSAAITITVTDPGNLSSSNSFLLRVNPVNDAPTLAEISDLNLNEDEGPHVVLLAGIGSGASNEVQTLKVTALSSDPAIIPHAAVTYTSPSDTGSLVLAPLTNAHGSATITVSVNDSQNQNATFSRSFIVTVIPTNDVPTISNIPAQATAEDVVISVPFSISDAETPVDALNLEASSSNPLVVPGSNLVFGGTEANRTLTITPGANQSGDTTITITVTDTNGAATSAVFAVSVIAMNDAPTLAPINNVTINEDAGQQTITLSGIGPGAPNESETLTIGATSSNPALIPNPTVNYTNSNNTGVLRFTPVANANGTAVITVTFDDGQSENHSFSRSFTVTVNSRNDPPTISTIANLSTPEDTPVLIPFTIGDQETAPFLLTVTGVSSNANLVANTNIVFDGNGTNRLAIIRPTAQQSGTATIRLTVNDGTTNISTTFVLTVVSVNDRPTMDPIADISVGQGGGQFNVSFTGVTSGAANENQTLNVTAVSSNSALINVQSLSYSSPNTSGSVRLRPGNGSGSTVIAVTVDDGGTTNGTLTRTFTVFVRPSTNSSSPVISDITDKNTNEDTPTPAIPFTVSDTQTAAGSLTLSGRSSNPALVPNGNIVFGGSGSNRTVTITPSANQSGTAIITVAVQDSSFGMSSDTFVLTVNPVNDAPSISSFIDRTISEDTSTPPIPFAVQDLETPAGSLVVTAVSSNQTLLPNANIVLGGSGTNRALMLTPAPNQAGTTHITVTVSDGPTNRSAGFLLTVSAVSEPPAISSFADQTTDEDTPTTPIVFTAGDPESMASNLVVSGVSSNPVLVPNENLAFSGTESNRALTVTPAANQFGTTVITVTVADEESNTVSSAFVLTVLPVNDPPTLDAIGGLLLNDNAGPQVVALTGIGPGAANENQMVALSVRSSQPSLIIHAAIDYESPDSSGTLTFWPVPGVHGTAIITVTANDGQSQNNLSTQSFEVTLNATPAISNIPDQTIPENASTPVPFVIGDVETAPESLILAHTSSNPGLIPNENLWVAGTGSNLALIVTPANDRVGSAVITISVTDAHGASSTNSFEVFVVPTAPIIVNQPQSRIVAPGTEVMFRVVAAGSSSLGYQWQHNGVNLGGQTGATLRLSNVQSTNAGNYTVAVTNPLGTVTSIEAQLTIIVPAQIVQIAHAGSVVEISFTTTAGQTYALEFKHSLDDPNWTVLDTVTGTGGIMTVTDAAATSASRFYRVRSP